VKVCIEAAAGEKCLDLGDIELQPAVAAEYQTSCLGIQEASKPPVQKASNGVDRCCYEVFPVCVGRPLFLDRLQRLASLQGDSAWS
jgi:hypothetical protein